MKFFTSEAKKLQSLWCLLLERMHQGILRQIYEAQTTKIAIYNNTLNLLP